MTAHAASPPLTPALEDYLESIYQLVRESGFARVRDIAKARSVRSASVTPALRRLDEMGLIRYERREYVALTKEGEEAARRVFSRHQLLSRFFAGFLGMSPAEADANACTVEHSLSEDAVDKLVRYFEFVQVCPGASELVSKFRRCSLVHEELPPCPTSCAAMQQKLARKETRMSLADLAPGEQGRVQQIGGGGAVRQRLLDMGILPNAVIEVARKAPAGDPIWIRLQGYELALRDAEAAAVLVEAV